MPTSDLRVTVVGIGADGWDGLTPAARAVVDAAEIVLGGPRQLALLPVANGRIHQPWPSPLSAALPELLTRLAGQRVVALASGDPMLSGIGSTLVDLVGADRVTVIPHLSSVTLARARLGWSAESTAVVSVVGRDVHAVLRELAPGRRVLVLSSDEKTPATLADLLVAHGYGPSRFVVLGGLGGEHETVGHYTADSFAGEAPRLNIVALQLNGPLLTGWATGLPDGAFEHDGQLTKRDVRAAALARLLPAPGQLLWDVGAGAGSVGIEWMRAHPGCRTVAVEADATRAERIARNARTLGVPELHVVCGAAPESLSDLATPDAIFVGGGVSRPEVLQQCLDALPSGGRIVAHGVTVQTEAVLAAAYAEHGGELTRIHVEHAAPIGSFTGFTPARAVTQWALTKQSTGLAAGRTGDSPPHTNPRARPAHRPPG